LRAPITGGRGTEPIADWGHIDVRKFAAREWEGADLCPAPTRRAPAIPMTNRHSRALPREVKPGRNPDPRHVVGRQDAEHASNARILGDFYMVAQWFRRSRVSSPPANGGTFLFTI